jgi:hypothetical protein
MCVMCVMRHEVMRHEVMRQNPPHFEVGQIYMGGPSARLFG